MELIKAAKSFVRFSPDLIWIFPRSKYLNLILNLTFVVIQFSPFIYYIF